MKKLIESIESHEEWLMERILHYAHQNGYVRYTSTLKEAWRMSIAGLSDSIISYLRTTDRAPDFAPDDDFTMGPTVRFGLLEARRHRQRGSPRHVPRTDEILPSVLPEPHLPDCAVTPSNSLTRARFLFQWKWLKEAENR